MPLVGMGGLSLSSIRSTEELPPPIEFIGRVKEIPGSKLFLKNKICFLIIIKNNFINFKFNPMIKCIKAEMRD